MRPPSAVRFTDRGLFEVSQHPGGPVLDLWDALVVALAHQHRKADEAAHLLWSWAHAVGPLSVSDSTGALYGLPTPESVRAITAARPTSSTYDTLTALGPAARVYGTLRPGMCADHLAAALTGIDGLTPSAAQVAVALHLGHLPAVPAAQPDVGGGRPDRRLVVVGASRVGKTRLLETVSEIPPVRTDRPTNAGPVTTALDYGRLTLDGRHVHLVGAPGQARFAAARAGCLRDPEGVLVLHDPADDTAAVRDLLRQLTDRRRKVPHVLALTHSTPAPDGGCPGPVTTPLDLTVDRNVPVLSVDPGNRCSSTHALRILAFLLDAAKAPDSTGSPVSRTLAPP